MKTKKLYSYTTVFAWGIFIAALLITMLIFVIIFPKQTWFLCIGIFLLILALWYLICTGFFSPIELTETKIKYRGEIYDWKNIRITVYPVLQRSYQFGYYLVFGIDYLSGKELKKQIHRGFWIYLKKKPLNEILKYYKYEIKILNEIENYDNVMRSTKKINTIIKEHNDSLKK